MKVKHLLKRGNIYYINFRNKNNRGKVKLSLGTDSEVVACRIAEALQESVALVQDGVLSVDEFKVVLENAKVGDIEESVWVNQLKYHTEMAQKFASLLGYESPFREVVVEKEVIKEVVVERVVRRREKQQRKGLLLTKPHTRIRHSEETRRAELVSILGDENLTFVGWVGEYVNNRSRFVLGCKAHGVVETSVKSFMQGRGCPHCKGKNQKQAYLHLVKDGDTPVAIKYGIAKLWDRRLREVKGKTSLCVENIGVWNFPTVGACKKVEKDVADLVGGSYLKAREFPDGWTETTTISNTDTIIRLYESAGGVRIK